MTHLQALLETHQLTRLLRISFPRNDGPQAKLMVNRFIGSEYVSRDFKFRVELLSDGGGIELEAMHGKLLCVSLVQADGSLRPFTGYVASFTLVKSEVEWPSTKPSLSHGWRIHACAGTIAYSMRQTCASRRRPSLRRRRVVQAARPFQPRQEQLYKIAGL